MFDENVNITCFRSVRLYDYATKTVGKSDEVKRHGRLKERTHTIMNSIGETWDIVANDEQIKILIANGYTLI